MENTRNKPARRRLPPAVYLAFLLIAALAFTGTSAASYKTQATGTDSARVARFVVTAAKGDSQSDSLTLDSAHTTAEYNFTVANSAGANVNETATKYDVVVEFPSALTGVTLALYKTGENGALTAIAGKSSDDNKTFTFANAGSFAAAAAQTDTFKLTFTAGSGASNASWKDIKITVNAAQVD